VLTTEQKLAIRSGAREHGAKNIARIKQALPTAVFVPTDARYVKVSIPLPDGTYIGVQVGNETFLDDRLAADFAVTHERRFNEAEARTVRYDALRELLLEA